MLLLQFLPLYAIIFAANLVPHSRGWRWISILLIVGMSIFILMTGLTFLVAGPDLVPVMFPGETAEGLTAPPDMRLPGILMAGTAFLGLLLLSRAVREGAIRLLRLHMDPESTVHMVALVFAVWLLGLTLGQLFLVMQLPVEALTEGMTLTLATLWEQGVAFTLFAILGVGLGLRRGAGEALERLGVVRPTGRQLGIAVLVTVALILWDRLLNLVWEVVDPASLERISQITEMLFGDLLGPLGAVTIGLSAGIGEELLFRGALQPRFGLGITTLLFTVGHVQYELSPALLSVFVIGLVLGIIRQRYNTTVAIIIHAAYNAIGVLLAPLGS